MEKDFAGNMNFIAKIPESKKHQIGSIRHWNHLKIAKMDNYLWLKGFSSEEIKSTLVRSIPYLEVYFLSDSKLYPVGKKVPVAKIEQLIWTPILKGLPIDTITFNHNLFEVNGKIEWHLKKSDNIRKVEAMLIDLSELILVVSSTPKVRLDSLEWTIVDHKALIIGTPPLSSRSQLGYWKYKDNHYLPLGYEFQLSALERVVREKLGSIENHLVFWDKDGKYSLVAKDKLVTLSRASVRRTVKKFEDYV